MIEFQAGEIKELNVALTPIVSEPVITIEQMFIGTIWSLGDDGAYCGFYIQLKNTSNTEVSGILNLYDWQAWWKCPKGEDRHWAHIAFTIPPGGVSRHHEVIYEKPLDTTYFRYTVEVGGVVVTETPRIYIIPGKMYTGSEKIAVGECTHMAPGLAVLWYSQYESVCKKWYGNYHTPVDCYLNECLHYEEIPPHDTDYYDIMYIQYWPAVFLVIMDPNFIPGAEYHCNISGANRTARFDFVFTG